MVPPRTVLAAAFLTVLLPAAATAAGDKCGPLAMVNSIQMTRAPNANLDLVPVTINGAARSFLFDTGGDRTQIRREAAVELNLPIHQGTLELYGATGNMSRDQASIRQFVLGHMQAGNASFLIAPQNGAKVSYDGILAPDYLESYDTDMDFGSDRLNFFSPDHCPGGVVYWGAGEVATAPLIRDGLHIFVPVTLDGHAVRALVDTGATYTALRMDIAQRLYGLSMGSADAPENGTLNNDPTLKTYSHIFKSLSFGNLAVNNPRATIIPNAMGRNADRAERQVDRSITENIPLDAPELIIGMDVLRKLHIYMAFREKQLYISAASAVSAPLAVSASVPPLSVPQRAATEIAYLNAQIAAKPDDPDLLNRRCFMRGLQGHDLDAALADCDQALKLKPGTVAFLDRRAMILYLEGKYQAALEAYNAILKIEPGYSASRLMRGYARGKLGDQAGKTADVAAAKAGNPGIEAAYERIGIRD